MKIKSVTVFFIFIIGFLVCSTSVYGLPSKISYHAKFKQYVEIYATFKGVKPPKPDILICAENMKYCDWKYNIPVPKDATDLRYEITDPKAKKAMTSLGLIQGNPGDLFLSNLGDGLFSLIGWDMFLAPQLFNENIDLFIGVDLTSWLSNPTSFDEDDVFTFLNGESASLSGFTVGTSEISFSSLNGWVTANPFTGSAELSGTIDGAAVPEPTTMLLLSFGLIGLIGMKKFIK